VLIKINPKPLTGLLLTVGMRVGEITVSSRLDVETMNAVLKDKSLLVSPSFNDYL
jgi:hypothetical protein